MKNADIFAEYGSEKWVIEQNLCFLLQEYWQEIYDKGYVKEAHMPINPVGFTKEFMKEDTLCDIECAEKSKMQTLEKNVIDIDPSQINIKEREVPEIWEPEDTYSNHDVTLGD